MEVSYSREFKKDFAKLQKKTQLQFFERLTLYLEDPQHPLLRVHTLSGEYLGYKSFNVTADVRVIFTIRNNRTVLYLDMIGTHSQLYK
jgi:addiction module RelE/StbE family toxin